MKTLYPILTCAFILAGFGCSPSNIPSVTGGQSANESASNSPPPPSADVTDADDSGDVEVAVNQSYSRFQKDDVSEPPRNYSDSRFTRDDQILPAVTPAPSPSNQAPVEDLNFIPAIKLGTRSVNVSHKYVLHEESNLSAAMITDLGFQKSGIMSTETWTAKDYASTKNPDGSPIRAGGIFYTADGAHDAWLPTGDVGVMFYGKSADETYYVTTQEVYLTKKNSDWKRLVRYSEGLGISWGGNYTEFYVLNIAFSADKNKVVWTGNQAQSEGYAFSKVVVMDFAKKTKAEWAIGSGGYAGTSSAIFDPVSGDLIIAASVGYHPRIYRVKNLDLAMQQATKAFGKSKGRISEDQALEIENNPAFDPLSNINKSFEKCSVYPGGSIILNTVSLGIDRASNKVVLVDRKCTGRKYTLDVLADKILEEK